METRRRPIRGGRGWVAGLLLLWTVAGSAAAALPPSLVEIRAMVVGLAAAERVIAAAVPLASGLWGTDYVTVSHALRVGMSYTVTTDNKIFHETERLAACSSQHHGIDLLVVRVRALRARPVPTWGDPIDLQRGDELFMLPRPEFSPEPVKITFLHVNFLEWMQTRPEAVLRAWHNVMIANGPSQPGFSGSPWVKDGKVYGLLKGRVRPGGQSIWYAVAESSTRIQDCLRILRYAELVPRE